MTSRQALRAALDGFVGRDVAERSDVERIRALIDAGDPWLRSTPLHVTCSAIVVDLPRGRLLLRWHGRMKMWMQVGGHADEGESDPWQIAFREAQEETGLPDLTAWPCLSRESGVVAPIQVVIVPVPAHRDEPAHEHADIRYLFATQCPDRVAAESPDTPLKWLSVDAALQEVSEENLRELLQRAGHLLQVHAREFKPLESL